MGRPLRLARLVALKLGRHVWVAWSVIGAYSVWYLIWGTA